MVARVASTLEKEDGGGADEDKGWLESKLLQSLLRKSACSLSCFDLFYIVKIAK